jgi:hypothetical protein
MKTRAGQRPELAIAAYMGAKLLGQKVLPPAVEITSDNSYSGKLF